MSRKYKVNTSEDIRVYLYVSDTKVNTLFEQISTASKPSLHGAQMIRNGLIEGLAGAATENGPPSRNDKVRAVENYLFEHDRVGSPQEPKEYFKGVLPMRWGIYNDLESRPENSPPLVYFGGLEPATPLIVGLGGSSMHVLGHDGATSTYSRSATSTLVRWIAKGLYNERGIDGLQGKLEFGIGSDLFAGIGIALHNLRPPTQRLEFLAKTLCVAKCQGLEYLTGCEETHVVLGTPLYVRQIRSLPKATSFGLDDEWKRHLKNTGP